MLLENLSGEMGADRSLEDGDRIDLGGGVTSSPFTRPATPPARSHSCSDGADLAFAVTRFRGGERTARSR
jgi:hypothetical protein